MSDKSKTSDKPKTGQDSQPVRRGNDAKPERFREGVKSNVVTNTLPPPPPPKRK